MDLISDNDVVGRVVVAGCSFRACSRDIDATLLKVRKFDYGYCSY